MNFVGIGEILWEHSGTAKVLMQGAEMKVLQVHVLDLQTSYTSYDVLLPDDFPPELIVNAARLKYKPAIIQVF
jgi:hypothetical protein